MELQTKMKDTLDHKKLENPKKSKHILGFLTALLFRIFAISSLLLLIEVIVGLIIPNNSLFSKYLDEYGYWIFIIVLVLIPVVFLIGTFHATQKERGESFDLLFHVGYGLSIFFILMVLGIILFGGSILFGLQ